MYAKGNIMSIGHGVAFLTSRPWCAAVLLVFVSCSFAVLDGIFGFSMYESLSRADGDIWVPFIAFSYLITLTETSR